MIFPPDAPIRPIETCFGGHLFRSRLEARWAVLFTVLGIEFDYEVEGYVLPDGSRYLCDFWLPQVSMHAEVKPNDLRDELSLPAMAFQKAIGLAVGTRYPVLLLDGPPRDTNYWAIVPDGQEWSWVDALLTDPNRYHLTEARFFMDTGARIRCHLPEQIPPHPAVIAARQARFETRRTA